LGRTVYRPKVYSATASDDKKTCSRTSNFFTPVAVLFRPRKYEHVFALQRHQKWVLEVGTHVDLSFYQLHCWFKAAVLTLNIRPAGRMLAIAAVHDNH